MRHLSLITALLVLTLTGLAQDLPCKVGPKSIRAVALTTSNSICLSWPTNQYRLQLHIDRRIYTNRPSAWQNWVQVYGITNNSANSGQFCDTTVGAGTNYEYRVSQFITNYSCSFPETAYPYWYYQHFNAGTWAPLRDSRGNLELLVESGAAASLISELATLTNDLIGDGYKVFQHNIAASEVTNAGWAAAVTSTKSLVVADYNTDPTSDWTIFIVGHVPIPYSGDSSPGGHTGNLGAHPADWYYADTNSSAWTDTTVNDSTGDFAAQHNVPGDGKFDQSTMPTAPEMRVGRVDFRNMPAFSQTEVQLLSQYLKRDHAWRTKQVQVRDMGIINSNNNAGLVYRALPADAWDIQSGVFGTTNNTVLGDWLRDAGSNTNNSFLFAASYGNGWYTQDLQVAYTTNFANTNLYAVFCTHFGSYFGDWDSAIITNCVLLAPLCTIGNTLANYYHSEIMNVGTSDMDEPIGNELFSEVWVPFVGSLANNYLAYGITDTNTGVVTYNGPSENLYISLMGDPTLRQRNVAPPANAAMYASGPGGANRLISWTYPTETNVLGFHVYRAPPTNLSQWVRLTAIPTNSPYLDTTASSSNYTYWVRTVALQTNVSRSFLSASEASFSSGLAGTNYWVATNGNNSNPGSDALPFLTIQQGVTTALANDRVTVKQGTYVENVISARDGPVTVDGQGVATLNGYWAMQNKNMTLENFTVRPGTGQMLYMMKGGHGSIVSNCVVDGGYSNSFPLLLWDNPYPGEFPFGTNCASSCLIISNIFQHGISEGDGVKMFGSNNVFTGNICRDYDTCDWLYLWGVSNKIVGNLFTNLFVLNGSGHPDCIQEFGPTSFDTNGAGASGLLIESNEFINCMAQICMLEGNNCINCFTNFTIRNNLFVRIESKGTVVLPNVSWYNNTFIECATNTAAAAYVFIVGSETNGTTITNFATSTGHGTHVYNNVFYNCGDGVMNKSVYDFYTYCTNVAADYNFCCGTNYGQFKIDPGHRAVGDPGGWDGGTTSSWWENHGINGGNPGLIDPVNGNYAVTTNSFLYGAGTNLSSWFTTDIAGNLRPATTAWTIGAYEAASAVAAPPPPVTNTAAGTVISGGIAISSGVIFQ